MFTSLPSNIACYLVVLGTTLGTTFGQQVGLNPNPGSFGSQFPNANPPPTGQFPQTNFPTSGNQFPSSTQTLSTASPVAFLMVRGMRNPTGQAQSQQQGSYIAYRQELTKLNAITSPNYGAFTVSLPGVYFFSITAQASTTSPFRIALRLNNNVIASLFAAQNQMMSTSTLVAATTGQIVYPILAGDISDSSFSGFLITPIYTSATSNVLAPNPGSLQTPRTELFPNSPFAAGLRLKMNSTLSDHKKKTKSEFDDIEKRKHENKL